MALCRRAEGVLLERSHGCWRGRKPGCLRRDACIAKRCVGNTRRARRCQHDGHRSVTETHRRWLVPVRDHALDATGYDIFVAQRANTSVDFPQPSNIPSLNASGVSDASQWILPDNSAIYFHSNRSGTDKIYRATRNAGGTFDTATSVTLTTLPEASPVVSADELTIYFGANTGGATAYDIYMATRPSKSSAFGTPQLLAPLSSNENEFPGWISDDGCELYFNRVVTGRGDELFRATRGQ